MKKILIFSLFIMISGSVFTSEISSWEKLKKIIFYNSMGKHKLAVKTLKGLSFSEITRNEKIFFIKKLENLGNFYAEKKMYKTAELFYRKIEKSSKSYWQIQNSIEKLSRKKGALFYNFKNFMIQILYLVKNFDSSFLLLNLLINVIYYSGIFVFFIISIIFFLKYFKLLSNDIFFNEDKSLSVKNIFIFMILIFWPVLIFSGWIAFPFLISGLLWIYMDKTERNSTILLIIIIVFFSLLFSFNKFIEKNVTDDNFEIIESVSNGYLHDKEDYSKFDNELKVFQAYSYYEKGNFDVALDILLSTGERYDNIFKYNLMGAIYLQSGNLEKSTKIIKKALDIDENNKTALHNFTIGLARQKNTKVFNSYTKRFPKIIEYKSRIGDLEEIRLSDNILWKRLLSSSNENFSIVSFVLSILKGIFKLPVLYFFLIFFIYRIIIKKIFNNTGESTNCSKCNKIIKETSIDMTHKFCDECYQLFMIKDLVFQEAKISKEEQLNKTKVRKLSIIALISFVFPGINLNFKGRIFSYVIISILFYSLFFFSVAGIFLFNKIYSMNPILLNITLILSFVFYLLLNLYSIKGSEYDGI
ncbi:MAG: hypothetical protein ABFR75_13950 [Acidobacteriota bacterium]